MRFRKDPVVGMLRRLVGQQAAVGSLTGAQRELLKRLTVQPVNDYLRQVWEPIVGPLERIIGRFVKEGLLEDATPAGKLAASHGTEELKALLRQYGVTPHGTKLELAVQVATALPANEVQRLTAGVRLYRATAAAQSVIAAQQEGAEHARESMHQDALDQLIKGDVGAAAARVDAYRSAFDFVGREPTGQFSLPADKQAAQVLRLSYDDIIADADKRREVAAWLALSQLGGQRHDQLGKALVRVLGGTFPCPALQAFLRESPSLDYIPKTDPNNPVHVAQLYAHTRLAESTNAVERQQLLDARVGRGIKIISHTDSACVYCVRASRTFTWQEISGMPGVPMHWGCRCTYAGWVP